MARALLEAVPFGKAALSDDEFACAVRTRIGATLQLARSTCTCDVAESLRAAGRLDTAVGANYHARVCRLGGRGIIAHNDVRDALHDVLVSWVLHPGKEVGDVFDAPPTSKLRMDIVVPKPSGGGRLAVDVSMRDAGAGQGFSCAAALPRGGVADARVGEKHVKYDTLLVADATLHVFAMDNFGACARETLDLVTELVRMGARATDGHASDLRMQLRCAVSVAFFRGLWKRYCVEMAGGGLASSRNRGAGSAPGAPVLALRGDGG